MKIVTAGPNEALIISGLFHNPPTILVGGRAIIIPSLQKIQKLQLNTMTLVLKAEMVYTNKGVPISITGIGQVKCWLRVTTLDPTF
jgi:flotillin